MPELEWKPAAIADLMAIADYISDDNKAAAIALLDEIGSKVSRLMIHPSSGRSGRVVH